jgi:organic radical activating enzyme
VVEHFVDETPQDKRALLPNIEFYITNVCNLTCTNCNRFNNHDFRGVQLWKHYENDYQEWARWVKLQKVTILGGEPLLNPSILDWIYGINRLWGRSVQVLTNGTRLNHVDGLYDAMLTSPDDRYPWVRNWIGVSLHNVDDRESCFDQIRQFLKAPVRYIHKSDPENHDNSFTFGGDHAFVDANGVKIPVWEYDDFYTAAIVRNPQGRFTVHRSDPQRAHDECGFVRYHCYHFIKGKLHKCGPAALFAEFDSQMNLDLDPRQREIMSSYQGLSAWEFAERGEKFLAELDNPIPQCEFCPESFTMTRLKAVSKKAGSTSGFQ